MCRDKLKSKSPLSKNQIKKEEVKNENSVARRLLNKERIEELYNKHKEKNKKVNNLKNKIDNELGFTFQPKFCNNPNFSPKTTFVERNILNNSYTNNLRTNRSISKTKVLTNSNCKQNNNIYSNQNMDQDISVRNIYKPIKNSNDFTNNNIYVNYPTEQEEESDERSYKLNEQKEEYRIKKTKMSENLLT